MAHESDPRTLVLLGLRLKGFAGADVLAETTGVDVATVEGILDDLMSAELAVYREGGQASGFVLTPPGRAEGTEALDAELAAAGARDTVQAAYDRFLVLNGEMLQLCTDWQVRDVDGEQVLNDHSDAAYDQEVLARLVGIDEQLSAVLAQLNGALARYRAYGPRFQAALEKLLAGDLDYFTKPLIPSYHTVWFELHEDLLATLDIDRAAEESAG
jgi:hypothetical protein